MIEVTLSQLVLIENFPQQFVQLSEAKPAAGEEPRKLTMVIGPHEAEEIGRCLRGEKTPRPLTHELAFNLMRLLDGKVRHAVIHDLKDSTYYAELRVEHGGALLRLDCRPSDAIALSLRGGTPVYITEEVFESANRAEP